MRIRDFLSGLWTPSVSLNKRLFFIRGTRYAEVLIFSALISSCSYTFYSGTCPHPQPNSIHKAFSLDDELRETSGLDHTGDTLWTFNDSGGEAALYAVNSHSGARLSKVLLEDTENIDWEDIAADTRFFYVADIGNNYGRRDTLYIYRVSIDSLRSGRDMIQHSGVISFTYAEEKQANEEGRSSHDAEALILYNDSLYLFTKNWVDQNTVVYKIPAVPGNYLVKAVASYPVEALVTAADIRLPEKEVTLLGYRNFFPVVITYRFATDPSILACGGEARRFLLRWGRQVEGFCYGSAGKRYVSAEARARKAAMFIMR